MPDVEDTIRQGFLVSCGLLPEDAAAEATAVVQRLDAEGIETVRVVFTDQHGILRGKTIVADRLVAAFASGIRVPSTLLLKDTSHRTVFPVWSEAGDAPMHGASDVLLAPQPETLRILPWSPHAALIHCDVALVDGAPVRFAARAVLKRMTDELAESGLAAVMGLEVEFQIFEVTDPALEHEDATMPPRPPRTRGLNQGYQYLTETRYGETEELLDLLRRTAQAMGMSVWSVEIEMGPSQFEFTFAPGDPMAIAEMAVNFRTMVKEVCHAHGLHASFMAKPKLANAAANGWHIHQSVVDRRTGENLFVPEQAGKLSGFAGHWLAGLLEHAPASCLLTTPTVNGYKRYAPYQLAPNRIGWGEDNRGAMVRTITAVGDAASRIENRVPDSTANPYFALASQIASGLDGWERKLVAPEPLANPYDDAADQLPGSLLTAIDQFEQSVLYRDRFGDDFVDYLAHLKRAEWQRYLMTVSEWEQMEYFSVF